MDTFYCGNRISSSHVADKIMSTYDDEDECENERRGSVHGMGDEELIELLDKMVMDEKARESSSNLFTDAIYEVAADISMIVCEKVPAEYQTDRYYFLDMEQHLVYFPYAYDFGPVNLSVIARFCKHLTEVLQEHPDKIVVLRSPPDRHSSTNTTFLLGCFLVLEREHESDGLTMPHFKLPASHIKSFRDASFLQTKFELTLRDVWQGLEKAQRQGWISPDSFDLEEYEHYDDPHNGDMHVIIPKKLVALKGPVDKLANDADWQDEGSVRLRRFKEMGVKCIIRLNEEKYDPIIFTDNGIEVVDLYFEDCPVPPSQIVFRFIKMVESTDGMVAVHCDTGLGRTGTLIARGSPLDGSV
ncbi:hypothetical protein GUITHDRAFT_122331 [Guillardia theta CCMP2712]|uniref:protein-tyrosine-phosphatase n=1 Tax=Guillardia theta (strain CCMP2712) TaxID=905079 RepID=L1I5X0_GUITC|nr:hypothetical protein GUITHDRAFT_122331 [Guillardia theta CCMP2712]EKX31482.1 hypothetical protein GUITHDRAFT_122331 [Guillardia theta CCMP2712]|eukprot:XP_005818462.1 hypothetical protein GUITHDRAFT_122331 [Guillardia theta CCMP2712]